MSSSTGAQLDLGDGEKFDIHDEMNDDLDYVINTVTVAELADYEDFEVNITSVNGNIADLRSEKHFCLRQNADLFLLK